MATKEGNGRKGEGGDDQILVERFVSPTAGMLRNEASPEVQRDTELGLKLERERVARVQEILEERRRRLGGALSTKPSPES